jgi:hypothetical protein
MVFLDTYDNRLFSYVTDAKGLKRGYKTFNCYGSVFLQTYSFRDTADDVIYKALKDTAIFKHYNKLYSRAAKAV